MNSNHDGDWSFGSGTAGCGVSVTNSHSVMVRVSVHAAFGVESTVKVVREHGEAQHRSLSGRVEVVDRVVLVSQTISPCGRSLPVLVPALGAAAAGADQKDTFLVAMLGSTFTARVEDTVEQDAP